MAATKKIVKKAQSIKKSVQKTVKKATGATSKAKAAAKVAKAGAKKATIKRGTPARKETKASIKTSVAPKKKAAKKEMITDAKKALKKPTTKMALPKDAETISSVSSESRQPKKKAPSSKKAPTKATKAPKADAPIKPAQRQPAKVVLYRVGEKPKVTNLNAGSKREFDEQFLNEQKELLLVERESHLRQIKTLREQVESMIQEDEPGDIQFDEESGEGDPLAVERQLDEYLTEQELGIVDQIDEALRKIDLGTYGYCENCHKPISRSRLRAMPFAKLCFDCKSRTLTNR